MSDELIAAGVGAIVGAGLTWFFSIQTFDLVKRKSFQEDIGIIKSKLLAGGLNARIEEGIGIWKAWPAACSSICCIGTAVLTRR